MSVTLHCFGESGNAYKVALALELAGIDWRPEFVDFFGGQTREETFRHELNIMGEVPVLTAGEMILTQSGVMLDWIVGKTGALGWTDEAERREVFRWVFWDNHKLSTQVGMTRFLMNFMPAEKRSQSVIDFMQGRLHAAYAVLNAHLQGRDWIVGRNVTVADLSCCSYLYYPEPFGFDRADWPEIDRWLAGIAALPGWKHPYELMPREG